MLFRSGRDSGVTVRTFQAIIFRLYRAGVIFLDVAARHDPIAAKLGQACHDIDVNIGIAIGPGGVVDANGRFATFQNDFAHGDLSIPDMDLAAPANRAGRSEEHTSELQSLMRISYAVFCLKKKNTTHTAYN